MEFAQLKTQEQCMELKLTSCYQVINVSWLGHVMTTEQTPSADVDHKKWLKAVEQASMWTLSKDYYNLVFVEQ